jgi:hypothetical protein
MEKQLLFSLSKSKGDFVVQPFKGSGNGGQKRNKTMSCCRITHPASGTVSECQEERSYEQNKKIAFERLINKPSFLAWHRIECAKKSGVYEGIEQKVNGFMEREEDFLIEVKRNGKWTKVKTYELTDEEDATK